MWGCHPNSKYLLPSVTTVLYQYIVAILYIMELSLSICVPYSIGVFSVLRHENSKLSYTALWPTSIRFSRDTKQPHLMPLRRESGKYHCGSHFLQITMTSLPKVAKEHNVAAQPSAMIFIGEAQHTDASNQRSQPCPRDRDRAAHRHIPQNACAF